MVAVHLVCEGFRGGLDERVLNTLVIQFHNLGVLIAPAGGSKGLGAVRAHLEKQAPANVAISIADRDYRAQVLAQNAWGNAAGRTFIWHRHEIENSLLQPRIVFELFNDYRAGNAPAWAAQLQATEAATAALLQALAIPLIEDHAAKVLTEELIQSINGSGNLRFGPARPAPPAGAHAAGQAQWLPVLQQEAHRLRQTCNVVDNLPQLQPLALAARYQALLIQYQNPVFLNSEDYLIDMAGKELLASLSRHLIGLGAPARLNRDFLADELLRILTGIYQPNLIYNPDDFATLANVLTQY